MHSFSFIRYTIDHQTSYHIARNMTFGVSKGCDFMFIAPKYLFLLCIVTMWLLGTNSFVLKHHGYTFEITWIFDTEFSKIAAVNR